MHSRESRRPPLPERLTPAERDFYLELRRLVDTAGYSLRALEGVTSGSQCFFSKSQWGRWLNGQSLPPRRAVRTLAGRLGADDIDASHLIDLWGRAFVPGADLLDPQRQMLVGGSALADTGPTRAAVGEPERAVPRELPPAVLGFIGRAAELQALTGLLGRPGEQGPGVVVVTAIGGTAGVGKTALAVHWAHQVADRFPDGQLYVNLRGYDPAQPVPATDALAGFLRSLGVPGPDIPAGEDERAARYRSMLAGKRMLVLLDNAGSVGQVRPLLPGSTACAVLVTSRDCLTGLVARDGAARLDLDVLPAQEAVALLRALIGVRVDAEPEAAAALAGQCCRLPLALRVAAELAVARPAVPLAGLAAGLADLSTRLDVLETGEDPCTQVRTVFSWSCRQLDVGAARAFRLLGLHPGPDLDLYAAAALADATVPETRKALDALARARLIHPSGAGRYAMHDLLRGYACEMSVTVDGDTEQRAALSRLFDHYLHAVAAAMDTLYPADRHRRPRIPSPGTPVPPLVDPATAREWLDRERATLVAVTGHAAACGWPGHATRMPAILSSYLRNGGHCPEALTIFSHALRAARSTGDRIAEAKVLLQTGLIDWQQSRDQQAANHYQQALDLIREAGDHIGKAQVLAGMGLTETLLGRYEHAAGHQQEAIASFRDTGDRLGEARALGNLGAARRLQGRYQEAADYYQQSLDLSREIGDHQGEAWSLARLGIAALCLGHYHEGTGHLQQALAVFHDMGSRDSEATTLAMRGAAYQALGCFEQAAADFEHALTVFREIGDHVREAEALNGLGHVRLQAGKAGKARAHYAAALRLATQAGTQRQQARAHNGLARAFQASGDPVQARHHWQEALTRYDATGAPEAADQVSAEMAAADEVRDQRP